jgi:anthranilate phosphoribosyltransferase
VIGTFSLANAKLLADVVSHMNHDHTIVLTSEDGLDEASLTAPVHIFDIRGSVITESVMRASDYGLEPASAADLGGGDASRNAEIIMAVMEPRQSLGPHQRIVVLNAALGFYVAGKVTSIADGVELARNAISSGQAKRKLQRLSGVHPHRSIA